MQVEGAVIREQGLTFAVVVVKSHIISNHMTATETIDGFGALFPGMPIVLMAQDSGGTPTYFGRTDIANFMASVPVNAIPWKRYTFN